ncbi:hypothetical protein [Curtobacterium sp. Leaf261]|uniref:hypothetical protein n=1 Tax=Curtobacterium sp. Leaf261 TaxID=1736311 RepID=UPI0006F46F38|nr:hypothetical protein [Curtobacterium sp. Leaf261]KQO62210.1 hypothetical protein ASF23_10335 [Curtobacterium sp. Leaf261]
MIVDVVAFLRDDVGYDSVTVQIAPLMEGRRADVAFTLEDADPGFVVVSWSRSAREGVEASFTTRDDALRWVILRERIGLAADRGRPRTAKLWESVVPGTVRSEMVGRACVITWRDGDGDGDGDGGDIAVHRATFHTPFAERDAAAFASQRDETLRAIRDRVVAIADGAGADQVTSA